MLLCWRLVVFGHGMVNLSLNLGLAGSLARLGTLALLKKGRNRSFTFGDSGSVLLESLGAE